MKTIAYKTILILLGVCFSLGIYSQTYVPTGNWLASTGELFIVTPIQGGIQVASANGPTATLYNFALNQYVNTTIGVSCLITSQTTMAVSSATGQIFYCIRTDTPQLQTVTVKNETVENPTGRKDMSMMDELRKAQALRLAQKQQIQSQEIDKTPPQIVITSPQLARGFVRLDEKKEVLIEGDAKDQSKISEVTVNGESAQLDERGHFSIVRSLLMGENRIFVTATDVNHNTSTAEFVIEKRSQIGNQMLANKDNKNLSGKFYALIIGNNNYQDPSIATLNEPVADATKLFDVLTLKYTFEQENVFFLKNASYVETIEAFDKLSNKITPNDNLLVFYAGHGWWDETKNLGYWLPSDAKKSNTAFWIPNSRISDYMSSINSKHTLLIADACFSGSIFKTRSAFADAQPAINKLYEMPSKKAMTSGNLKEVPDKSVFLQYLVKRLQENTEKYISSDVLFTSFRQAVLNNSATEPQYGTIQNAGDEGGEFIFIAK